MGLLGVARANTAVGVSPETFLLLLLQECDRAAVRFVKKLLTTVHWLTSVHQAKDGLCTCTLTKGSISICMVTYLTTVLHALQLPKEVVLHIAEIRRSSRNLRTRYRELDTAYNSMEICIGEDKNW
jgi:hypothetical protein